MGKLKRLLSSVNLGYRAVMSLDEKLWRLQNDANWTTIQLPIDEDDRKVEEVLVEKIGENQFRLSSSPGMVEGLAAADVIGLDADTPAGFHLLKRGGNVCIHLFCDAGERETIREELVRELGRLGGGLDGTMGETGLCFTVPVEAGFARIEGVMQRAVGDEWYFSNVHDLETNEPLNWWLKPETQCQ